MFKTNSTTKVATYLLIGTFFLLLCGYFACGNVAHGQPITKRNDKGVVWDSMSGFSNKDSIPPLPKRYVFVLDSASFVTVDSILKLSMQVTGYSLPASQADGLRNGVSMILSWLYREKGIQDAQKPKK